MLFFLNINILLFFFILLNPEASQAFDLTIIGTIKFNDGLGRIPIGIIEHLSDCLKINCINTINSSLYTIDDDELSFNLNNFYLKSFDDLGDIILFTEYSTTKELLFFLKNNYPTKKRIIYSMFETSKIPNSWVNDFNELFDYILVPDESLIKVYKESGIHIPIYFLPLGLYLDCFKVKKKKKANGEDFIFSCLSSFDPRKNHEKLIKAFALEFGNLDKIYLKINGRSWSTKNLVNLVNSLQLTNVIISNLNLKWSDYVNEILSTNVYVSISKGEGFSIGPRESLCAGIPTIITNNTAQKFLCDSGWFIPVKSQILEKAFYSTFNEDIGFFYDCDLNDLRYALRDVYENYKYYEEKIESSFEFVEKYDWKSLKYIYLEFFKKLINKDKKILDK